MYVYCYIACLPEKYVLYDFVRMVALFLIVSQVEKSDNLLNADRY